MNEQLINEIADRLQSGEWTVQQALEFISKEINALGRSREKQVEVLERGERLKERQGITVDQFQEIQGMCKEARSSRDSIDQNIQLLESLSYNLLGIYEKVMKQKMSIQPIKWLKSEEALRQLIDSLKEYGLFQIRETEDIIQHFEISGREAKQAKLEPINWLKSKVLLAYLIDKLSKEPEQSAPFIDSNKKWELAKLHFVVKDKKITRSLVGDYSQSPYPNGSDDIDAILKRLPVH